MGETYHLRAIVVLCAGPLVPSCWLCGWCVLWALRTGSWSESKERGEGGGGSLCRGSGLHLGGFPEEVPLGGVLQEKSIPERSDHRNPGRGAGKYKTFGETHK